MSMLTELLMDDRKAEAKALKPLVNARADAARLEASGDVIDPIVQAIADSLKDLNLNAPGADEIFKKRVTLASEAIGKVLVEVSKSR